MARVSWDKYFFDLAKFVSARSTCSRASCGAVIVSDDNRVLSTGYNGAPAGLPHCTDVGCQIEDGHCVRANHAEFNAVHQLIELHTMARVSQSRCYVYRRNHSGGSVGTGACAHCMALLSKYGVELVGCWDDPDIGIPVSVHIDPRIDVDRIHSSFIK